jgi:hypothetical protein
MCWAAGLSVFGIAGFDQIPYSPVLLPMFAGIMLVNLVFLWFRGRARRQMVGFGFAAAGAFAILVLRLGFNVQLAAPAGVALTWIGSILSFWKSSRTGIDRSQGTELKALIQSSIHEHPGNRR